MNDEDLRKRQEEAQLSQAVMMRRFKESQEFELLNNVFAVKKLLWSQERQIVMKTQSTREMCLYYTGKEDAATELLLEVDKIISDGEAITKAKEVLAQYED